MEPDEIRISYAMFRELWKHLVSKRKARKLEVDRHVIWQRLADGRLALRERAAGSDEAAVEEGAVVTLSLDNGGQVRNWFSKHGVHVVPIEVATPSEFLEASAPDALQTPDARVRGTAKPRGPRTGKPTREQRRGMSTPKQSDAKKMNGNTPIKHRRTAAA